MSKNLRTDVGCSRFCGEAKNMRKFTSNNKNINEITFKGIKYFFILDKNGIGVRRQDDKKPKEGEVEALTEYLFDEGWADREDYDERESWQDNA